MAADSYNPVSLRQKSKKKARGNATMSRRRISVKELGQVDHEGWLYRKREDKGFLGMKWKKYWFVLKKTSLYWYANQTADKAEGYINLTDFMIDRAIECKKKYAIKACHPQVMIFYFAAESSEEMNKWLNKLGLASILYEPTENTGDCYSEGSDHEEAESTDAPPPPYSEPMTTEGNDAQGSLPPPYSSAPPSEAADSASSPVSTMTSQSSRSSLAKPQPSQPDTASQPAAGEPLVCSAQVHSQLLTATKDNRKSHQYEDGSLSQNPPVEVFCNDVQAGQEESTPSGGRERKSKTTSDEMEEMYIHLKEASLSPTGQRKPSTKRDFRQSFIRRCKNHNINEKLHLVRTLNSTLKAKEADLATIEQLLADPAVTAAKYREWKEANLLLHQEICQRQDLGRDGDNEERPASVASSSTFSETSV